jgi:phosphatidylglycerophosphate synthase
VAQPPSVLNRSAHESWMGRLYMRRLSIYVTWLLTPTRVGPDAVTVLMGLAGVAAAGVLLVPSLWAAIVASALLQAQILLDCCDGELARWRGRIGSTRGVWLDGVAHSTTDALLLVAVGVHADGGVGSFGGWTSLGLVASVLGLLVHSQTDHVYVARSKTGLGLIDEQAVVPQLGVVRTLRSALRRLPVNRLLSAWDLGLAVLAAAIADRVDGSLAGSRVLTAVLVGAGCYAALGPFVSVLTSRRLR